MDAMRKIIDALSQQVIDCADQTGVVPSVSDYEQYMESEEFNDLCAEYGITDLITFEEVVAYMFQNWR